MYAYATMILIYLHPLSAPFGIEARIVEDFGTSTVNSGWRHSITID